MSERNLATPGRAKRRHITIRVPVEVYKLVTDHARMRGLEVGPMVEGWVRPIIDAIKPIVRDDDVAGG